MIPPLLIQLFQDTLTSSLHATWLVGVVMVAQGCFRRWITPGWRYALWFLVVARLLLPALPPSTWSVMNLLPRQQAIEVPASPPLAVVEPITPSRLPERISPRPHASMAPPVPPKTSLSFSQVAWNTAAVIWLLGMVLMTARTMASYRRLRVAIRHSRPIADRPTLQLLEACKTELGIRRNLVLVESTLTPVPAIAGVRRPHLLLPPTLVGSVSPEALRLIFLHELMHLRRLDLALNWVWRSVHIFHWFNPVVWWVVRRILADREIACDAAVLGHLASEDRHAYGSMLIQLKENLDPPTPIPSLISILHRTSELKRRITMISTYRSTPRSLHLISATGLVTLGVLCLTGAAEKPATLSTPIPPPPSTVSPQPSASTTITAASAPESIPSLDRLEEELQSNRAAMAKLQARVDDLRAQLGIRRDEVSPDGRTMDDGTLLKLEVMEMEAKAEFQRRKTLHDSLAGLTGNELRSAIATTIPDPLLSKLLEEEASLELRMVEASVTQGPQSSTIRGQLKVKETLDRKIQERLQGILAGLRVQIANEGSRLEDLHSAVEKRRAEEMERSRQRHPYDDARRELRMLETMRERLEERLIQERIERIAHPTGSSPSPTSASPRALRASSVQTVEITRDGVYRIDGRALPLDELAKRLQQTRATEPNLVVHVRMNQQASIAPLAALLDRCNAEGISNISLNTSTQPTK